MITVNFSSDLSVIRNFSNYIKEKMNYFNGKPFFHFEDWLRSELNCLSPQYLIMIDNVHSFLVPFQRYSEEIATVCVTEFLNGK